MATGGPDLEWVSPVINPSQGVALWCSGPRGLDPGQGRVRSVAVAVQWLTGVPDPGVKQDQTMSRGSSCGIVEREQSRW